MKIFTQKHITTVLFSVLCLLGSSCTENSNKGSDLIENGYQKEFVGYNVPGFYSESAGEFNFPENTCQYSIRHYNGTSTVDYRMISTDPATYVTLSNAPESMTEGETYQINVRQNLTYDFSDTFNGNFTLIKSDGPMAWLYDSENELGIIIRLSE